MGLISDLKPLNLEEEKQKFFQNFSYNPQFVYVRDFSQEELLKYGTPRKKYYNHAIKMLDKYGIFYKKDVQNLSPQEIENQIQLIFQKLKTPPIKISFMPKQISRVLIKDGEIMFKSNIAINQDQLISILNHEIQTHFLRKWNDTLHNLDSNTDNNVDFRLTEEGLANLHSFIERKDKIIKKSFLTYMATYCAQENSFSKVFSLLKSMGQKDDIAWNITVKQKRGLNDTSQPGGFSKDLVYFEGIVKIWQWMMDAHNDPRDLYLGRIGLADITKTKLKIKDVKTVFPTFMLNLHQYMKNVIEIGKVNEFEKLI